MYFCRCDQKKSILLSFQFERCLLESRHTVHQSDEGYSRNAPCRINLIHNVLKYLIHNDILCLISIFFNLYIKSC